MSWPANPSDLTAPVANQKDRGLWERDWSINSKQTQETEKMVSLYSARGKKKLFSLQSDL